jgi:hypothetical protein
MDFRTIFQLRDKKIWWMDVIFYLAMSLLVATILCYLVFIVKNIIQANQIKEIDADLQNVGTQEQKEQEKEVILYKQKISSFVELIKNHEFVSNAFSFLEENTQPNVWFTNFSLDEKGAKIQLSCIAEDMDAVSRQISTFEKNEYVKDMGSINSSLGDSGQANFNLNLSLENTIFSYLVNLKNQKINKEKQKEVTFLTGSLSSTESEEIKEETAENQTSQPQSTEKTIYSFDIPLNPEVVGKINQTDHTISAVVPAGTDIASLAPIIFVSEKATIFPESDVSQNFTQPVVYEVKAEDGTTQNYTVTIKTTESIVAQETTDEESKQSWLVKIFLIIALVAFIVIIALIVFLILNNKRKKN